MPGTFTASARIHFKKALMLLQVQCSSPNREFTPRTEMGYATESAKHDDCRYGPYKGIDGLQAH
jgi:hypothetical protein